MNGNEWLRRLRRLAKERGMDVRVDRKRGKGSHVTVYFGSRYTIVPQLKNELKPGTFRHVCSQLEVDPRDLD